MPNTLYYGHLIIRQLDSEHALVQRQGEGFAQGLQLKEKRAYAIRQPDGYAYVPNSGEWLRPWEIAMVLRRLDPNWKPRRPEEKSQLTLEL